MRVLCNVASWFSGSVAVALFALATLAVPSGTALADTGGGGQAGCFTCTDYCPSRAIGIPGCRQGNYCVDCFPGVVCVCDPVGQTDCECNN